MGTRGRGSGEGAQGATWLSLRRHTIRRLLLLPYHPTGIPDPSFRPPACFPASLSRFLSMFLRRPPSSTPFLAPLFPCRRRFPNDWADRYQVCLSRDTHEWGADRLRDMQDKWEPTPEHMILMDVKVCTCLPAFPSFSPVWPFFFGLLFGPGFLLLGSLLATFVARPALKARVSVRPRHKTTSHRFSRSHMRSPEGLCFCTALYSSCGCGIPRPVRSMLFKCFVLCYKID